MKFTLHTIKILFFLLMTNWVVGQTETELKENANDLFEQEEYVEATSIYLQLLSLNPKSGDYNFRYGTCLLFNSYHKKDAIRYLNYAVKQTNIDPRAFYFYGKSLHLNYQFREAIEYYKIYLSKREKRDNRYNVEREILMCQNGQKLLVTFTDIVVKNKKEIDHSKFFRLYDNMETVGGEILVSEEFQSKMDKKKGHVPILHFPPNAKAIYYSSYGDGDNKDIYVRKRLPNGKWGDPQVLMGGVNTPEDEDFPFMHSSGDFLFFSSKGHNSMGGYDIFMSRFDPNTNSFKKPENVDFAISSPDDDLFYVVDKTFQNAYFASARQSQNGKLHVYNVRVARVPIREVIVMGDFLSEINPENKDMSIAISSFTSGDFVGKTISNVEGKYSFVFPRGGKYNYEVTIEGSGDVYKFVVDLPFLDEFRPLKQKVIHTRVDGQEIVKIVNLFDEKVEGAEALIAEVIRKKAELEVNIDDFDLKELEAQENRDKILAEIGFDGMSIREVSNQLEELTLTEELKQKQIKQIVSNVNNEIIEKSKLEKMYETSLSDVQTRIEETDNPSEKHGLLNESLRIEHEKKVLLEEIIRLEKVKNDMASTALSSDGKNPMNELETKFNQLIQEEKEDEALALLVASREEIQITKNQSPTKIVNEMIEESIALTEDIKLLNEQQLSYEQSKSELHSSNILLENSLPTAKKKEKEKINAKIAEQKEELNLVMEMKAASQKSIDAKNEELYILDNNIASVQKALVEENNYTIHQDEVEQILKVTTEAQQNSNVAQIEQEMNDLEKEHPELREDYVETVVENNSKENGLEKIETDYDEKVNHIINDITISKEEKDTQILALNNNILQELDERMKTIDSKLEEGSNEELESEKEDVASMKETLTAENEKINESILARNKEVTKPQFPDINENYEKAIAQINSDDNLSEIEKNKAKIEANDAILQKIESRIETVRTGLSKNPASKSLKNEQSDLNALTKSLEKSTSNLNNDIAAIENGQAVENNTVDVSSITPESMVTETEPDHVQRITEIENNSSFSEKEKLEALNEEDQKLLDELIKVQKKIEKEWNKDREDEILSARNKVSKQLIETTTAAIEERNQTLEAFNSTSNTADVNEVKTRLTTELSQNYLTEIEDANSLNSSGIEKEKNILMIEQAQLERIIEKKAEVELKLNKAEENNVLSQEVEVLKQMEMSQIEKVETQKRKAIASISVGDLEQAVLRADQNYTEDIAQIEQSNSAEKNIEKAVREVTLQKNIQTELEQIEKKQKRSFSVTVELDKAVYELALEESVSREKSLRNTPDVIAETKNEENVAVNENTETNSLSKVKIENENLVNELEKLQSNEISNSPIVQKTLAVNKEKSQEIEQLEQEAQEAKSEEEKAYLMEQAIEKQDELNSLTHSTLVDQKINQVEKEQEVQLFTQEELKKRQRSFTVRIGQLTTEIERVEVEISEAKRKAIAPLELKKASLLAEKELFETQLRAIEERILEEQPIASTVTKNAKETEVTFNEERKIASSESYKEYEILAIDALNVEKQIRNLEQELNEAKKLLSNEISTNPSMDEETLNLKIKEIKRIQTEIDALNVDLIQKKYLANEKLPKNKEEAMKMQNLVYRGIKPLKVLAVATLLQMPSEGFSMNKGTESTYSSNNPIPVDVKNPTGLVYRVQIGAFSKPIPQDLFKEFTPVSGEVIQGTKVVRYMAGFFNNSKKVVEARQSIRELGYSDAFIVAYCDGERIGFGEARRREANGTCVPKGNNDLMVEVATNTAEKLGIPLSNEVEEVPEVSYNQAPGAAPADPIEMMQGLFFTVQIGVFNRPVSDEVVYNLPELLTIRLPNGQIRYNTGLFNTIADALPRRKESLSRGIVGAFVVAYYKGKRIPIAQAKHLLNENGSTILQTEIEKKEPVIEEEVVNHAVNRTDTVTTANLVSVEEIERNNAERIQIVTKKQFDEFPRDVLNRYNAEGSFYYDDKDKKVKSFIYKNADDLPRLWNFIDDIDTVYLPLTTLDVLDLKTVSVSIEENIIPGDFMDWILRSSYYHEVIETESGLELRFYGVENENLEELMTQIKTFVLSPELIENRDDDKE